MDAPLDASLAWARGYRHQTAGLPGVSCAFREELEDFEVEEVPAYEPSGEGEHLYLWIEKRGVGTPEAEMRLARALHVPEAGCGHAGRKDARGVTRQWLSFHGARAEEALELELDGIRVLRAEYHSNKLRVGHLVGNRFTLVLRGIGVERRGDVEAVLRALESDGMPNYFGEQRFGRGGRAHELGQLLVADDREGYVHALVSPEHAGHGKAAAELRRVILAGERSAYRHLGSLGRQLDPDLAALAKQLARRPGSLASAVRAIPKTTRRFHVNALQSWCFNGVVAARLERWGGLGSLWPGDMAQKHDSGGCFRVEDAELDTTRAGRMEISPTGPMPGPRMDAPEGEPGELEAGVLEKLAVVASSLGGLPGGIGARGVRRALRVPLVGLEVAWEGERLRLSFQLPKGSYATTLVEEVRKLLPQP
ncbi:MAG: tRNA pseudouridine13 synthase [Planctomycetota bacterium]|jgi:tRNA pseudouridine13 synthase